MLKSVDLRKKVPLRKNYKAVFFPPPTKQFWAMLGEQQDLQWLRFVNLHMDLLTLNHGTTCILWICLCPVSFILILPWTVTTTPAVNSIWWWWPLDLWIHGYARKCVYYKTFPVVLYMATWPASCTWVGPYRSEPPSRAGGEGSPKGGHSALCWMPGETRSWLPGHSQSCHRRAGLAGLPCQRGTDIQLST